VNAWHDLVTASLIGTERAVVPAVAIPGLPPVADDRVDDDRVDDDNGDSAAVLLDRAAMLTVARRAGRRPDHAEPLPTSEPDPRPAVGAAAARRLTHILGGEYRGLLLEWLRALTARGLRLPPQLLPTLLDRASRFGSREPALARLVAEAGGPRAQWLAELNPDWAFVAAPAVPGADAWRLGDHGQRRGYLAALAATDQDAAMELVKSSWDTADHTERTMFLSVLADVLGLAAEPLLEAALDGGEGAPSTASWTLARLPGSALGQRMAERALRCVRVEREARGTRLVITPPTECDASMQRDGIIPGPPALRAQPAERTRLLLQVVTLTPLRTWTEEFGLTPAQIVALPAGDWSPVLFSGWAGAAVTRRDQDWMAALIGQALTGHPPKTAAERQALDKLARRADPVLGAPGALPEPRPDALPVVGAALDLLRFRYEMLKELDHDRDHG
jgi:hypothetical protein